jgi:AcrR family transcriptional regulator
MVCNEYEAEMNAPAHVIKQGRKWDQVLEGARKVFLRDGFEGASVDDIVREAGVSKATLYSYFPDKRLLFLEVAKTECAAQSDAAVAQVEASGDIREVMTTAAKRMVQFFMSDVGLQVHRIVVGESQRFPEIGREFYESGPARVHAILRQYLQKAVEDGELKIDDIDLAADQLPELCKAGLHLKMVLGLRDAPTEEEIDRVIDGAVDMFLARYGVKG